MHDNVAAPIGKRERNAQKVLQSHSQFLAPLRWHEKQHEASTSGSQEFSAQCAGGTASLIDLVDVAIRYVLRKRTFDLPGLIQQTTEFLEGAIGVGDDGFGLVHHLTH